jgi:hypothetical protein
MRSRAATSTSDGDNPASSTIQYQPPQVVTEEYAVDQQYGLLSTPFSQGLTGGNGQNEKYLQSSNNSNPGAGRFQLFVLTPDGELRAYNGRPAPPS